MTKDRLSLLLAFLSPVIAGIAFMAFAGAAKIYLITNAAAACVVAIAFWREPPVHQRLLQRAVTVIVPILLVLTFVGPAVDGVNRWIAVGPFNLHVAMLTLPFLATQMVSHNNQSYAAVSAIVALLVALQPDRASALALFFVTLYWLYASRGRWALAAFVASCAALFYTTLHADTLPTVRFVENVIGDAADLHAGFAVLLVISMVLAIAVPLYAGSPKKQARATAYFAWAACLTGYFLSALAGPYPVPLLGYGVSPILGFGLALAMIAREGDHPA